MHVKQHSIPIPQDQQALCGIRCTRDFRTDKLPEWNNLLAKRIYACRTCSLWYWALASFGNNEIGPNCHSTSCMPRKIMSRNRTNRKLLQRLFAAAWEASNQSHIPVYMRYHPHDTEWQPVYFSSYSPTMFQAKPPTIEPNSSEDLKWRLLPVSPSFFYETMIRRGEYHFGGIPSVSKRAVKLFKASAYSSLLNNNHTAHLSPRWTHLIRSYSLIEDLVRLHVVLKIRYGICESKPCRHSLFTVDFEGCFGWSIAKAISTADLSLAITQHFRSWFGFWNTNARSCELTCGADQPWSLRGKYDFHE